MSYSQTKALWAITKASFKAIFSQPSSLFFSFLFPIIFILIFGAFSERPPETYKVAISPGSDTSNVFFDSLKSNASVKIIRYADTAKQNEDLVKGNVAAVLQMIPRDTGASRYYQVLLRSSEASGGAVYSLMHALDYQALRIELNDAHKLQREYLFVPQMVPGKKYRQIDFVLPGQLGFS